MLYYNKVVFNTFLMNTIIKIVLKVKGYSIFQQAAITHLN